jgi:hypothetical protein
MFSDPASSEVRKLGIFCGSDIHIFMMIMIISSHPSIRNGHSTSNCICFLIGVIHDSCNCGTIYFWKLFILPFMLVSVTVIGLSPEGILVKCYGQYEIFSQCCLVTAPQKSKQSKSFIEILDTRHLSYEKNHSHINTP